MDTLIDDAIECIICQIDDAEAISNFALVSRHINDIFITMIRRIKARCPSRIKYVDNLSDTPYVINTYDLDDILRELRQKCRVECWFDPYSGINTAAMDRCDACARYRLSRVFYHITGAFKVNLKGMSAGHVETAEIEFVRICKHCRISIKHTPNTYYINYTVYHDTIPEFAALNMDVDCVYFIDYLNRRLPA